MKKTLQVKLDEEATKKLKEEATLRGHTISSIIRFIIKEFLEKLGGQV